MLVVNQFIVSMSRINRIPNVRLVLQIFLHFYNRCLKRLCINVFNAFGEVLLFECSMKFEICHRGLSVSRESIIQIQFHQSHSTNLCLFKEKNFNLYINTYTSRDRKRQREERERQRGERERQRKTDNSSTNVLEFLG